MRSADGAEVSELPAKLREAFERKRYGIGEYDPDFDLLDAAADEIERLNNAAEAQKDISGMLRAQLRMFGHIPCVVENEEVGKAERQMRAKTMGN